MTKQVLVEFKDIVAISPMATFDPVDNKLTVTLLLRKDKEFYPQILKLSNGAEDFVYALAVNEVPQVSVPLVTMHSDAIPQLPEGITITTTLADGSTFVLNPSSVSEKPLEAPDSQEASNTPVVSAETSGKAVNDTEGQQEQGGSSQFVKMPESVVQTTLNDGGTES